MQWYSNKVIIRQEHKKTEVGPMAYCVARLRTGNSRVSHPATIMLSIAVSSYIAANDLFHNDLFVFIFGSF